MLENKNIFINILLAIWQIPQIIVGIIMLCVFRNKEIYVNDYNHIKVWRISHKGLFGTACFSTGPFIITTENATEETLKHETGHSLSSIRTGWLYHIVISIPSICFFWYRRIKNKDMEWYYSCWTERAAERNGMTDRYKAKIENKKI